MYRHPLTFALILLMWAGSVLADSYVFPRPDFTSQTPAQWQVKGSGSCQGCSAGCQKYSQICIGGTTSGPSSWTTCSLNNTVYMVCSWSPITFRGDCPEHSIVSSDPNYCIAQDGWAWNQSANGGAGAMEPRAGCGVGQSYIDESNSCSNNSPLSLALGAGLAGLGLILGVLGLTVAAPIVAAAGAGVAALGIIIGATAGGNDTSNQAANPPDSPITVDLQSPGSTGTAPEPLNNGTSPTIDRAPPTPQAPNPPLQPGGGGGVGSGGSPNPGWSTNPDGSSSLRDGSGNQIGWVSSDGTRAVITGSSGSTSINTHSDGSMNVINQGQANNSSGGGGASHNYNWYRDTAFDVNGNKVGESISHDQNTIGGAPVNPSNGVSYPVPGSGGSGSGSQGLDCPHCATEATLSSLKNWMQQDETDNLNVSELQSDYDAAMDGVVSGTQDLLDQLGVKNTLDTLGQLNPFQQYWTSSTDCEWVGPDGEIDFCPYISRIHGAMTFFLFVLLCMAVVGLISERPGNAN